MTDSRALALTDRSSGGGLVVAPQSFGEVMMFAEQMAKSSFVPRHLRGKPADCLAVCLQALRWGKDPFMVAQKTYFTNEGSPPGYEAQLIDAIIHSSAALEGRLNVEWSGAGNDLTCTVTGRFRWDPTPKVKTCRMSNITTKNSPLWKSDPEQQLAYFTKRAWARLYAPDIIMGIYTPEEMTEAAPRSVGGGTIDPETGEVKAATATNGTSLIDELDRQAAVGHGSAVAAAVMEELTPTAATIPTLRTDAGKLIRENVAPWANAVGSILNAAYDDPEKFEAIWSEHEETARKLHALGLPVNPHGGAVQALIDFVAGWADHRRGLNIKSAG